jgi:hypothetical protein
VVITRAEKQLAKCPSRPCSAISAGVVLPNPVPELSNHSVLISCPPRLMQEAEKVGRRHARKGATVIGYCPATDFRNAGA